MFRFIGSFFALIGFCAVLLIALVVVMGYYAKGHPEPEPKTIVLKLDFDEPIVEGQEPSPFQLAMHEEATPLFDILRAIETAKDDPHVKGVIARFGSAQPGLTQSQEIRTALARFRASGKFTYAFAASYGDFGRGNRPYYLASAFENIWLQPVGSVGICDLAVEMPFAKTALEKIGVTTDFMQREEYKSAMDNVTRDDFAPQVKTEMQDMLADLSAQIVGGIAESRKWEPDRVKRMMDQGPFTDDEALKNGLVTTIGYADNLEKEIDNKVGKDASYPSVEEYLSYDRKKTAADREKRPAQVALIFGTGLIIEKADGAGDLSGEHLMGANEIAGALDDAAAAKDVKAILFRVDSPGGSPEASETIRRAVVHAQKEGKPVIVSMGSVAASGGYWVAMNGDRILAEPATLTGSIGVIGGKFVLGGLMQKLGVNWDTVKTGDSAGMWSMTESFTPPQRERMNALMDQTYHAFVKNVSDARHIPMEKMPDIAKGRVWTGDQAIKIGLVDELGGYEAAQGAVRKILKLDEHEPLKMVPYPAPETPLQRAMKLMKQLGAESAMLKPAILQWQKASALLGLSDMVNMKPVELRMPETTIVNTVR